MSDPDPFNDATNASPQQEEVIVSENAAEADDEANSESSEEWDDDFYPPSLRDDLQEKFQTLSLSREEVKELEQTGYQEAYLLKALREKYGKPDLYFSCTHCALLCLYHGAGVVTDGELEELYYGPGR
ncbi:hypothetical protein EON63_25340 [archaeon]|nr:MAG: hypothetical protein EON63_25340 [archaeon]